MKNAISKHLWAWKTGIKDGWDSPIELGVGMSWPDEENYPLNETYDRGVNFGQFLGRLFNLPDHGRRT